MFYIGAGTYVIKSLSASTRNVTVDGEEFSLIGGVYHLVVVKEYGSYDDSLVTSLKVPNGTKSITIA